MAIGTLDLVGYALSDRPWRGSGAGETAGLAQVKWQTVDSRAGASSAVSSGCGPSPIVVAAALGPKMLDLAARRSLGTHPYFSTPEHTRFARERVGPEALVAPELAVVLEPHEEDARDTARAYAEGYLRRRNYTSNLLRFGFSDRDIADGGSDRLIDAVIPHGSADQIAEAVRAHLDAGADHVCLQPLGHGTAPLDDYRALANVLL